jgi:predicted ATPase
LSRQEEGIDGEPRFAMLETIREFGSDQLEAAGDADEARARHATFFLAMAEELHTVMKGSQPAPAFAVTIERLG